MSQNHPYLHLPVPAEAPFELKPSPGKGWGGFATRSIERGVLILKEKALFVIRKPHSEITEGDIRMAFQQLPSSSKQHFLCVRDNASREFTTMESALEENSFQVASEADTQRGLRAYGMFPLHSRFNHSCLPNSTIPTKGGSEVIAIYAARDIAPGEEITFCYEPDLTCRPRQERHQRLRFECDCRACQLGTPFQQMSDIRRRFIRGLQYLTLGVDLDGQKDHSQSPIIADPNLKRDAETFNIPLTSRLIYNILYVFLIEEEGLLDDFRLERLTPGVVMTVVQFRTEENASIAGLALAKGTWLERACMAFELYGRRDAADADVTAQLRARHGLS